MKKMIPSILSLLILIIISPLFSKSADLFQNRRQAVVKNMSANGLLILHTSDKGYRFGFNFRQNSDLYYLTGMNQEGITLILSRTGIPYPNKNKIVHSILLINAPIQKKQNKKNFYLFMADSLGYDLVCKPLEFRRILNQISNTDVLYTNIISKKQKNGLSFFEKKLSKFINDYPSMQIKSPSILTSHLRRIKSDTEIKLIQKAVNITAKAHLEAFKSMKPGLYEYQIEALVEFVFKYHGAEQLAFPTIIGAGSNSLELHYDKGSEKINPGDIVVMDIGCEYQHYCADLTRTVPASGKFSPEQKEIYNIVLEANKAIIDALAPGFSISQMDSIAKAVISKYGYEQYILHSCSHHLGLDVHDVGSRKEPFAPGCVITVEPGIYIPPDSNLPQNYWNIGVRIEDDVLITEDGHQVLSAKLPKTIEEIEKIMAGEGLIDRAFR